VQVKICNRDHRQELSKYDIVLIWLYSIRRNVPSNAFRGRRRAKLIGRSCRQQQINWWLFLWSL
jgi:hypothetical protein